MNQEESTDDFRRIVKAPHWAYRFIEETEDEFVLSSVLNKPIPSEISCTRTDVGPKPFEDEPIRSALPQIKTMAATKNHLFEAFLRGA